MIILGLIIEGVMDWGERGTTWVKIMGMPKGLSPTEMIQTQKFQIKPN